MLWECRAVIARRLGQAKNPETTDFNSRVPIRQNEVFFWVSQVVIAVSVYGFPLFPLNARRRRPRPDKAV